MTPLAIPLENDPTLSALIDAADAGIVLPYRWLALRVQHLVYARANIAGKTVLMHRLILPDAAKVDHRDGDGLNNRRCNLRRCTHQQNMRNVRAYGRCQYKGVDAVGGRFRARINPFGRAVQLGRFATAEEAARAYDAAALEHFGDFARLNFPPSDERAA